MSRAFSLAGFEVTLIGRFLRVTLIGRFWVTPEVYCKDKKRKKARIGKSLSSDFLGYCFRPRLVKRSRDNALFCGISPAVSSSAMKAMRSTIRGIETSSIKHSCSLQGHRPAAQSTPAGLDRILRALRLIGAVPLAPAHQIRCWWLG